MQAQPNQIVYVVSADGISQSANAQAHFHGMFPIIAPKAKAPINKLLMYGSMSLAVLGVSLYWGAWFYQQSTIQAVIRSIAAHGASSSGEVYEVGYGRSGSYSSAGFSESEMLVHAALIIVGLGHWQGVALGLFISGIIFTVLGLSGVTHALNTSDRKSIGSRVTAVAICLYLLQIFTLIGAKWACRSFEGRNDWVNASVGIWVMQGASQIVTICLIVFVCKMRYVESGFRILAKFMIACSILTGFSFPLAGLFEFVLMGTFEWPTRLLIICYSLGVAGGIILLICHAIEFSKEARRNAITQEVKSVV